MVRHIVSPSKFITTGIFLLFFSTFLTIIFTTFFHTPIESTQNYVKGILILIDILSKHNYNRNLIKIIVL